MKTFSKEIYCKINDIDMRFPTDGKRSCYLKPFAIFFVNIS